MYFDGGVQSLGFDFNGTHYTVGVVMPGEYHFGQAERRETIHVLTGILTVNHQEYAPHPLIGRDINTRPCIIQAGEDISIRAEMPISYICTFE